MTRIPGTLTLENTTIESALEKPVEEWVMLDEKHHFRTFTVEHYGLQQRWIVVYSDERQYKAEKSVSAKSEKEREEIEKALAKLSSEEFSSPCDAQKALQKLSRKSKFNEVIESQVMEKKKYSSKGRPKVGCDKLVKTP